jgi:hypothetical protein
VAAGFPAATSRAGFGALHHASLCVRRDADAGARATSQRPGWRRAHPRSPGHYCGVTLRATGTTLSVGGVRSAHRSRGREEHIRGR